MLFRSALYFEATIAKLPPGAPIFFRVIFLSMDDYSGLCRSETTRDSRHAMPPGGRKRRSTAAVQTLRDIGNRPVIREASGQRVLEHRPDRPAVPWFVN